MRRLIPLLLFAAPAFAQVSVPVPPVTPPPVPVTVTVKPLPTGCTQGTSTISGTAITVALNCGVVPPPSQFCNQTGFTCITPSGSNDEAALYTAFAKGPTELGCPSASTSCTFTLSSMGVPVNSKIYCDDNVTVNDVPGYTIYAQMFGVELTNVSFTGSGGPNACQFTMTNSYATNINSKVNQFNNCIWVSGANNVTVTGLRFFHCGGDGVYVTTSTNVTVSNIVSSTNIRNGASATSSLTNVTFSNNIFANQANSNAGICSGFDIEPNNSVGPINITLSNNQFLNNKCSTIADGLRVSLQNTTSSTVIKILLNNNISAGNTVNYAKTGIPSPMNGSISGTGNTGFTP